MDVPVGVPDQGVDRRQQSSLSHSFFEERAVKGCKGFHGDRDVGAGGSPCRAVRCEAPAGHHGVAGRMGLELSPPGREDAGKAGEGGADAALRLREPCEGLRRGVAQGLGGEAWLRAEKRAQGLRDGASTEAVRAGKLCVQVVRYPLLGLVMLTLRAVAMAPGMMDTVVFATAVALGEAVAVMPAAAVLDGADDRVVRGGEGGRARQGLRGEGVEDSAEGRQAWQPRLSASRRWEASSWPLCGRWRERMGVSRWAWPLDRCRARRVTPAARRWVAEA